MKKIIDISEHNGNIDFNKVKQSGVEGVIIRIGWIGNHNNHTIDKKFNEYYNKARTANLAIGFYVYSYSKSVNAVKSGANWTISLLKGKSIQLPVFIDLEDKTIIGYDLTNQAIEYCKILEQNGIKSGIYASKDWFKNKLDINKLEKYKIWLAEWNGKKEPTVSFKVDLWQYSDKGQINGINGHVDLDLCLCDCNNETKPYEPIKARYKIGKVYITQVNLKVRKNAGINSKWIDYNQLTPNAKLHAEKNKKAILKKGTKVTCQGIYYVNNDIWLKIPSGYIAGFFQGKEYIK